MVECLVRRSYRKQQGKTHCLTHTGVFDDIVIQHSDNHAMALKDNSGIGVL